MPPDMAISMRHTKLKAEEAALLAGEINKPSWESKNEGIHERVSFEDTIWGFDLAGGIFYKTPLRVTYVKPDSRAEKAGIRPGDKLLRINDLDTSTLTIQQAHDIIIESGIHLKLSVTAPEDEEDAYYCYEDPLVDGYDSEEERRREEELAKKRRVCARVSHYWSLQWPWVSRRRPVYRESNCFMVPSKYEDARRDKYPPLPVLKWTEDVVHFSPENDPEGQEKKKHIPSLYEVKEKAKLDKKERLARAEALKAERGTEDSMSEMTDDEEPPKETPRHKPRRSTLKVDRQETIEEIKENEGGETPLIENEVSNEVNEEKNIEANEEINEDMYEADVETEETSVKEVDENNNDISNDLLSSIIEENNPAPEEPAETVNVISENAIDNDNAEMVNGDLNEDDILNEVLAKPGDSASRSEEDNILDSILSDEGQNLENSESNNER